MGSVDRDLLCWAAPWIFKFHYDNPRPAHHGHDADAHATLHVGMVYHLLHRTTGVRRSASRLHFADSRSCGWNQLLCPFKSCGERSTGESFRRIAPAMAALVLVLRASGGLHCDPAGRGHCLSHPRQQLSPAIAQPQGHHLLHGGHRLP